MIEVLITRWFCMMVLVCSSISWAQANEDLGKKIATQGNGKGAVACMACHGGQGEGQKMAGFPALAGFSKEYLAKQLRDFKGNQRSNAVMKPIALALSQSEIQAVASYYAKMKSSWVIQKFDATNELGKRLAERGKWEKNTPSCFACHGPKALGVGASFPSLAGQGKTYLLNQLKAWKMGQRSNDPNGLMQSIVESLDDNEIEAVSSYLAGDVFKTTASASLSQSSAKFFLPPEEKDIPAGPFGDLVRKGQAIIENTPQMASSYVGNELKCVNCHLDLGRRPWSAPLWASFSMYPAYREKNKRVNTIQDRLQGCFIYSHNGKAPAADSEIITALVAYQYWLGQGAPLGKSLKGRGFMKLKKPSKRPNFKRGQIVYKQQCAICHGSSGLGQRSSSGWVFPPLWGQGSYNWGAGMHRVNTAAGFIKANMPLGLAQSLSDQQAWDVSLYINSQKRPEDPRNKGSRAQTAKEFHQHDCRYNK